nr:nucleolar protein 58-like [Tanacetum cinerariifolium]
MINYIKNSDQPLPCVTQVSIDGTSLTEQPPLKDKSMWSDQEKKIQKIDRLARSLLIQGLLNDIYSLIDNNKTAKDLWDALARHMLGSEYGKQDRKAAVLYEYETFKEWKQYATMMRQNKNLMDINIDALYNILKQNQGDVNDAMGLKKKTIVVTFDPLALIAKKTKVIKRKDKVVVFLDSKGSDAHDFSKLKKITALLAKAFNRRKFYSKLTNNNLRTSSTSQFANKKQEFVKSNHKKVEKKDDEKKRDMSKVKCYNCKKEGHFAKDFKKVKVKDYEYYKTKMLFAKKDKDEQVILAEDQAWMESSSNSDQEINANMVLKNQLQVKHVVIDTHVECQEKYAKLEAERYGYMIRYSAYFDNDKQHRKKIDDQEVLYDKMSVQLVELDKHVRDLKNTVLEKDFKIFKLEECVRNKDLKIEKCLERLNVCENKLHKMGQTNQTVHMIMPSKDNLYNGRKGIGFENPIYFEKAKDLRPTLYDEKVIGLGYTLMFLTHSDEALEIEKFKRSRENKIEFAYDYGNLNASYVNEKINFKDDYFQEIINPDFEKIDSPF